MLIINNHWKIFISCLFPKFNKGVFLQIFGEIETFMSARGIYSLAIRITFVSLPPKTVVSVPHN